MKIKSKPVWNHETKTVTIQFTDEQYDGMRRVDFEGQWHVLRNVKI